MISQMLRQDAGPSDAEIDELIDKALAVEHPKKAYDQAWNFVKVYFAPTVVGLEKVPERPTLFVGNHALFGTDAMIFLMIMHHRAGRFIRPMADKLFFETPLGDLLLRGGGVLANPKVCAALMEAGADLVVFPGGAAESTKAEKDKYTLKWGERSGFARMAAQHGYSITPFGMVGPDDCYDHVMEGEDLLESAPAQWLTKLGLMEGVRKDLIAPLVSGVFGTPIPKPQPCFLGFGDTIEVPDYRGKKVPKGVLNSVRAETAEQIEAQLKDLLLLRSQSQSTTSRLRRMLLS